MQSFAARPSPIKLTGNVLQTEAFDLPGTLPIYGSSELDRPAANRPDEFFRNRPTGFAVFPVGRGGTTCLMILQKLAAAGQAARGKKAVVFLSPTWFAKEGVEEKAVEANLTSPQLGAWLFGGTLSPSLREKIARRLLDYPESLIEQPLLASAVRCLADPTFANRLEFALLTPLGLAQNVVSQRLEYCAILREMIENPSSHDPKKSWATAPEMTSSANALDWARLAAQAEATDRARNDGATYSATLEVVPERFRFQNFKVQAPGSRNGDFTSKVVVSKEFADLDLLVSVLNELQVDALFISQPFNGIYRDMGGTTRQGRQVYYDKVANALAHTGYPLLDFSDHEEDRFFFNDKGHPSAKAWIYYNQGIDRFYHGIHG